MKIALIGASTIAAKLLPSLKSLPILDWVGFASKNTEHGLAFSTQHQLPFLGNHQNLLQNREIEAVYITALNSDHELCVESALNSGKHVICEKPLTLNAATAKRLFELASKKNLVLIEGLMYRFHPQIQELLRRVHSHELGKPVKINATFSFDYGSGPHLDRRLEHGGGALSDLGCYLVDFVNLVSKLSPLKAAYKTEPLTQTSFGATLHLENGLIANLQSSMLHPSINTWEVICERGSLSIQRHNPHEAAESVLQLVNDHSELSTMMITGKGSGLEQFLNEFINFHDTIKKSVRPFISAQESIRNAELIDSIRAAKSLG